MENITILLNTHQQYVRKQNIQSGNQACILLLKKYQLYIVYKSLPLTSTVFLPPHLFHSVLHQQCND